MTTGAAHKPNTDAGGCRFAPNEPFSVPPGYSKEQEQSGTDVLESQALIAPDEDIPLAEATGGDAWAQDGEWALVQRAGGGEQAALEILYRTHYNRLCAFVFRITLDRSGVEDIVNEVMMTVWQKAALATPQARVSTWIMGIAYHKALKASERRKRHATHIVISDEIAERIGADDTQLLEAETAQLAQAALARLPVEQRAVMELIYLEGFNYNEIGTVLNCPENTVKTRVFNARRQLRSVWGELTGSHPSGSASEKSEV